MRLSFALRRALAAAPLARLAAAVVTLSSAASVHAARPMITDDARIVDAQSCQVESWVRRNRGSTEYWALPGCNLGGNFELTLGGARTHEAGRTDGSAVVLQGKTLFKPLEADGVGIGLAAGAVRNVQATSGRDDLYAYVPLSLSLRGDAVVIHTNTGWQREGETGRDAFTWGLGTEARLSDRTWLIAETFGQQQGRPFHQIGLRHWLVRDRVQIDTTYGNRNGSGFDGPQRWFSIGLRLLSPPFLP